MKSGVEGPPRLAVVLGFAAVYLVWGSTYLAIRIAIDTLPPFLMAGVRFLTAGALLYAWSRLRGAPRPSGANWRAAAAVGAFLLLGGNGGVVWAEQRVSTGLAALLVATVPLWVVLLEWFFERRRPTSRVVLGLLVGFAGLAILIGPMNLLGGEATDPLGAAVLVLSSLWWAAGSLVSRRVPLPEAPQLGTGMEMLAGGALLALLGTLTGEWAGLDLGAVEARSWLAMLYLIVFGSLVAFSAYVWLLKHVDLAKVSTYAYVNPVVAVVLGWLVLGEPLTPRTLVAAGVIVAGVVFITTGRKRPTFERAETAPADAALGERR